VDDDRRRRHRVGVGKSLFGGLGHNPFNPALVGRAFLQAAFPTAMTTWHVGMTPDSLFALPASTSWRLPFRPEPTPTSSTASTWARPRRLGVEVRPQLADDLGPGARPHERLDG
jgi:hypothetical protein